MTLQVFVWIELLSEDGMGDFRCMFYGKRNGCNFDLRIQSWFEKVRKVMKLNYATG